MKKFIDIKLLSKYIDEDKKVKRKLFIFHHGRTGLVYIGLSRRFRIAFNWCDNIKRLIFSADYLRKLDEIQRHTI